MSERILHTPFDLLQADMSEWNPRPLVYHFFEIIHIQEGSGLRIVNKNRFPYRKGSIFLFTPRDCRGFQVDTPTRFSSIRFSDIFLSRSGSPEEKQRICEWLKQLEYIFFNHNKHQPLTINKVNDCRMITSLMSNMIEEYNNKHPYYECNLQHFVTLLLNIIARNVAEDLDVINSGKTEPPISRIMAHIRQHIYYPEQLKLEGMAARFNMSPNYIGEYFKKQTGESIQQFIICYKLTLVQLRVQYSNLTMSEIADELGFTDESHLSRLFKKYYGVSPAVYRKERLAEKNILVTG